MCAARTRVSDLNNGQLTCHGQADTVFCDHAHAVSGNRDVQSEYAVVLNHVAEYCPTSEGSGECITSLSDTSR